jgi:hypothetical protein
VQKVVLAASAEGGSFGQVPGLTLTITDLGTDAVLAVFAMTAGTETAFVAGELYRRGPDWKFRAVAQGYSSGLAGLAGDYGISVETAPVATPPAAPASPAPVVTSPAPAPAVSLKKQQLINMEKNLAVQAPALLSLTKTAAVSLEKRGLGEHTARVALCLDISGSMSQLYRNGKIQQLAERILALALRFDDDGEVDVFLFGEKGHAADSMNLGNYQGYIDATLHRHHLEGGTRYARAMSLIRQHYFGSSEQRQTPLLDQLPVYVMFVTDGRTMDEADTRTQVRSSSFEPLFWQFMAIGRSSRSVDGPVKPGLGSGEFTFLEELDDMPGRYLDNADFFAVADPANISDDQLFDLLMTEYPGWLEQARTGGLLPGR